MSDQPVQSQANETATQNAATTAPETLTKKRGAHKPDCTCGWCETKRRNLAKRSAEQKPAQPTAQTSERPAASQVPPKKSSAPMAAKIARMQAAKKNAPGHVTKKTDEPTAPKKTGFFAGLFSGPNTFFED
jgi:hypothetical protein